ncbi:MAG: phosphoadenosine phosphosulfate reductase family protein [Acidimicrobiaceae bacterium]|nr:phosphoadenosine phosphosulfate reductase family protein [Acidimicrobiaceae bacterium]
MALTETIEGAETASPDASVARPVAIRQRPSHLAPLVYRHPSHAALPHVVSFSGGRSSAALLFMAAEEGLLDASRGDLVLFANTSAEHPGTYEFAAECKRRIESDFGLPFFWFEFTTVEDAWRGEYWRKLSYRLVQPVPIEQDADGYRSSGELFEDLVNLQGMLPNVHSRTCTAKLKLYPSHLLLGEWLGGTDGPAHAGHYWDTDHEGRGGGGA